MSNVLGSQNKIYVKSGQLQWVGCATGPFDAVKKALEVAGKDKTLDGYFFFLDECGFRTNNAEFRVPLEEGLAYSGYIFDTPETTDED